MAYQPPQLHQAQSPQALVITSHHSVPSLFTNSHCHDKVEQKPDQNVIPVESWALNGITFGHIFRETAMTILASVSTETEAIACSLQIHTNMGSGCHQFSKPHLWFLFVVEESFQLLKASISK